MKTQGKRKNYGGQQKVKRYLGVFHELSTFFPHTYTHKIKSLSHRPKRSNTVFFHLRHFFFSLFPHKSQWMWWKIAENGKSNDAVIQIDKFPTFPHISKMHFPMTSSSFPHIFPNFPHFSSNFPQLFLFFPKISHPTPNTHTHIHIKQLYSKPKATQQVIILEAAGNAASNYTRCRRPRSKLGPIKTFPPNPTHTHTYI